MPKIVVQTHRSFLNTTERYAQEALAYRADDITLAVPKLYFGYASSNLFFPFSVGASAVLYPERPTQRSYSTRSCVTVRASWSMCRRWWRRWWPTPTPHPRTSRRSASPPRRAKLYPSSFTVGGTKPSRSNCSTGWEPPKCGTYSSQTVRRGRRGTVGRVVRASRSGSATRTAPGSRRRRRPSLGPRGSRAWGYWQDIDRTAEAFRGAWFVGGDLASRDRDGFITHRGRADDAVKVKGKWLRPQEVEGALLSHPAVRECAVIAVENQVGLLEPVAFVVAEAAPGLEEELQGHVLDRLEPYKNPRRVIVWMHSPRPTSERWTGELCVGLPAPADRAALPA